MFFYKSHPDYNMYSFNWICYLYNYRLFQKQQDIFRQLFCCCFGLLFGICNKNSVENVKLYERRNMMINIIIKMIFCHLVGDYVLQSDFIAKTKGQNWYHLFVHCFLYCLPFYIVFGLTWHLLFIFVTHLLVDQLKAKFNKINYVTDQLLHYIAMLVYLL